MTRDTLGQGLGVLHQAFRLDADEAALAVSKGVALAIRREDNSPP